MTTTLSGGGFGRDTAFGGPGNDTVTGGIGNDRLFAGEGNDTVNGNFGRDLISGGPGDDRSTGGPGNDKIFANRGVDESFGGDGNDVLWALARADVPLPGVDTLHGENGNDRFRTRDGEPDVIDCGAGRDTAVLDEVDVIVDATSANPKGSCEVVKRAAPKPKEDNEENDEEDRREERKVRS